MFLLATTVLCASKIHAYLGPVDSNKGILKMTSNAQVGLILGPHESAEVQSITAEIERQGHVPMIIDSADLSRNVSIEYHEAIQGFARNSLQLNFNGHKVNINKVIGVYWSCVNSPNASVKHGAHDEKQRGTTNEHQNILLNLVTQPNIDLSCLLQLLFCESQINWVNSFEAIKFHRVKPKQLSLARTLGAMVPATYVGNCPLSIHAFLRQHPSAIVKPVFAGGHTKRIPVSLHNIEEIKKWAIFPVTLQSFIPGDDVRTYIVGSHIFSAKIDAVKLDPQQADEKQSLVCDYREAPGVTLSPIDLPLATQQLAIRIMRAFHMQYTAIDWRLNRKGEFVFLEANPAPLFVSAQQQLGIDIDRAIVELMFA